MNEPVGAAESPLGKDQDADPPVHEPDVELPRAREDLPTPVSVASSLLAPSSITPWFSPLSPSSGHMGGASRRGSPNPFQATVESAPPSPRIEPVEAAHYDPAPHGLEEGWKEGNEDHLEARRDRQHNRPGVVGEPPTLIYVPQSPGQIRRGEPVTGWLCEPGWIRRRFRHFTPGDVEGDQQ